MEALKCPNCGSDLSPNNDISGFTTCTYCGTVVQIKTSSVLHHQSNITSNSTNLVETLRSTKPKDPLQWKVDEIAENCVKQMLTFCLKEAEKGKTKASGELWYNGGYDGGEYEIREQGTFFVLDEKFTLLHMEEARKRIEEKLKAQNFSECTVRIINGTAYTVKNKTPFYGGIRTKSQRHPGACLEIEVQW